MEPPSSGRVSVLNQTGRRLQTAPIRRAASLALELSEGRGPRAGLPQPHGQAPLRSGTESLAEDAESAERNGFIRGEFPSASARSARDDLRSRSLGNKATSRGVVCILLANDEAIRELNFKFRNLNEATDVLSFPGPNLPNAPLGDIAIAVPFAERQANVRGIALIVELQYLAIHGALHLLGWNDESDEERLEMQAEMARIAKVAGMPEEAAWHSLEHETVGDGR